MEDLSRFSYAIIPWLAGLLGLAAATASLVALKHYLDLRQASFFILRRRTQRTLRSSLALATLCVLLAAGSLLARRSLPEPPPEPEMTEIVPASLPTSRGEAGSTPVSRIAQPLRTMTPTSPPTQGPSATVPFIPTNTPTRTPTPTPTRTRTPTPTNTLTPSLTPSVTPTPSITPTPSPTVPVLEAIFTPVAPYATVPVDAAVGELTISTGVQLDGSPINPGSEFPDGQPGLYVSFDYENMLNGVLWRDIWFRDDALFAGETRVWEWGGRGRTYFYLRPAGGFPPGEYEVQFLLDDEVVRRASFRVQGP
jgi:hypothetical protein